MRYYCKKMLFFVSFISKQYSKTKSMLLQVKSKLKGHSKRITGLAFSHVLNVLVSSGADAQVCICFNTLRFKTDSFGIHH